MKKLTISMMVLLILTIQVVYAEAKEKPHFRQAYWGSTRAEVKATLTDKDEIIDEVGAGFAVENSSISDYIISYNFTDNKLTHGSYLYIASHINKNKYIDEYTRMQSILIEKYGEPKLNDWVWNDDLYKDNVQDYGMAICVGHLAGRSEWNITKGFYNTEPKLGGNPKLKITKIQIVIMGDNFEINFGILYESEEYYHLFEESKKKQDEDNF